MTARRALLAAFLALPSAALAHSSTQSFSDIEVGGEAVEVRLRTRDMDLAFALEAVDRNGDGGLDQAELEAGRGTVAAYFLERCRLGLDGRPLEGALLGVDRLESPEGGDHATNLVLRMRFELPRPRGRLSIRIRPYEENDLLHQHLALVRIRGGAPRELFLDRKTEPVLDLGGTLDAGWAGGVFRSGVEHILAGWDHLLFLAALILVVERPWALLGVVTGFTAGHTLTLVLAGLDLVSLPPRLTESAIAFSIAWVGVRNARGAPGEGRWKVAALFGLVHGFGFASGLRGQLPPDLLVPSLLVFNLGVEAGQLAAVALAWPLLRLLSGRPGPSKAFSWTVAAAGAVLCALRLFG